MKQRGFLIVFVFCLMASVPCSVLGSKTPTITARQAKSHIGQTAKVCGEVVSPHYAYKTRGQPTFLNFDRPYPHQVFTAVIWGTERAKFGQPEKQYRNKHVCVTGFISVYRGQPDMVLHSPKQITAK